jgi:hypothetical protein
MRLRKWIVVGYGAVGIGLLPWAFWLSSSLSPVHVTHRWDLAWSGFDIGLALAFCGTAVAAWRRSPWLGAFAAATGTLLCTDAWFDIVLESHADDLRNAVVLASVAELPAAAICFWIAFRTERFLAKVVEAVGGVEAASHLTAAGESPTQRDLIGVLEITPDGQPTGESGHAHPAP